jgi:multicomponent Na+:H+ antiporter subunit E
LTEPAPDSGAQGSEMAKAIVLGMALFGLWLTLSGYLTPFLLTLGVLSCMFAVLIGARMGLIDEDAVPLQLKSRLFTYWIWLGRETLRSNIAIARVILSRRMDIAQCFVRVPTSQASDMGRVIFANSITLTPGTVTVGTAPGAFLVHAVNDAAADPEAFAEMDRRVAALEAAAHRPGEAR